MLIIRYPTGADDDLFENQIDVIDCGKQIIRSGEDVIQGVKLASIGAGAIDELKRSIDKVILDDQFHRHSQ